MITDAVVVSGRDGPRTNAVTSKMRDEKVYAVVAPSTFANEKCQRPTSLRPLLEVAMSKKCTLLWREAHFQAKSVKNLWSQTTFGSCDVEKVHAVVERSTFVSKNGKNTSRSDHFWKLRCRKSAHRCGAKHICKSKVPKTHSLRPLLEVAMSKKCTPLWCEAHFQVKSVKNLWSQTTFGSCDVEKVHAVVARSTFASKNGKNTSRLDHFLTFRC